MHKVAAVLVVAGLYAGLGALGLALTPLHDVVSGIWPAAGLALAALWTRGVWMAGGIWIGALAINLAGAVPSGVAVLLASGNTGAALAAWWMLRRLDVSPRLSRLSDVGGLVATALVAPLLSAIVGVTALTNSRVAGAGDWLAHLGIWWSGDALGLLLVAPPLLLLHERPLDLPATRRWEAALYGLVLIAFTVWVFYSPRPYMYAVFPLTAVAAFRYGLAATTVATALVASAATVQTTLGHGPFTAYTPVHNLLLLQLFLGLLTLKGLVLAAALAERRTDRERLAALSRRVLLAHESERRVIARGLHDEVGQLLLAARLELEAERIDRTSAGALIEKAIATVRDVSFELHPAILDDLGLASAIRHHVDRIARLAGFSASVDVQLRAPRLPTALEAACFRLVQEALTNVVRHARASAVRVSVLQDAHGVAVLVRDDGVGFVRDHVDAGARGGIGLLGMQERAALVGGTVEVWSAPGAGTRVQATFPLGADR